MNGNVDRLLEAIRQRALVRSGRLLLQVHCDGAHGDMTPGDRCDHCGAAL